MHVCVCVCVCVCVFMYITHPWLVVRAIGDVIAISPPLIITRDGIKEVCVCVCVWVFVCLCIWVHNKSILYKFRFCSNFTYIELSCLHAFF
jgi:hypothetical protein